MAGTIAFSDLYGGRAPGRTTERNDTQPVAAASGTVASSGDKTPAMFWVGLVLCLVLLRVAWESAK